MIATTRGTLPKKRNALQSYETQFRNPTDIALQLTGRDYISHAQISTYQRCPLQFFFRYVAGLEPEFVSSSLVFGGAIHAAIESHMQSVMEGAEPPPLDELVDVYERAVNNESDAPIRFGKGETVDSLRDLAVRMLTAFRASEVSKLDTRIVAIEETIRGPVIPDCPDVLGRLDLVTLDGDSLLITDFKTSRSSWNAENVRQAAPQQLLYTELVQPLAAAFGDRPIRVEWIVLSKTKQPKVERHQLTPDSAQIKRTKQIVRRVWQAIVAGHFYPSPSAMNCSSCPYRTACDQWEADT